MAFPAISFPAPLMSFAVTAKAKGDEDKVLTALKRLAEEDPMIHIHRDAQTGEMIVGGMSQVHVEVTVERLKRRFGTEVELKPPRVPYRETIKGTAKAEGKHKKQTGGRGQFADTWMEVSPRPRGEGFEFVDKIVGGAIPRNFIPAVEKGIRAAMAEGFLAGYPVVDVQVRLYDGKYHPVDSSDMAFQIAGSIGFKAAVEKAQPVLLEPIMNVEITVPEENVGDIIGDLNSRRGRVLGTTPRGHSNVVGAEVPLAEMLSYAPDLTSMTGRPRRLPHGVPALRRSAGAPDAEDRRAGQEGARRSAEELTRRPTRRHVFPASRAIPAWLRRWRRDARRRYNRGVSTTEVPVS